jgi:hypothetical protein
MTGSRTGADAAFLCDVRILATYVHSLCDYTQTNTHTHTHSHSHIRTYTERERERERERET